LHQKRFQLCCELTAVALQRSTLKKLRVVVADDNPAFLRKLTSLLASGFDIVATAGDGKSALKIIQDYKPDAVVLDLAMPVLNGIEVTKELAKSPQHPTVVICSVESDPDIVEAAKSAGASAYVLKVRIENDLILALNAALKGKPFVSSMPQ
jgi:DNA-binding NarL/FixJ family response regulator